MDILAIALSLLLCFFVIFFFFFTTRKSCSGDGGAKIPPGPPRLPILGNIFQVAKKPHRSLTDLSRVYGSVMSLKLGCLPAVIVSSSEAAKELFKTHDHVLCCRISNDPIQASGHPEHSIVWLPSFARWRFLRKITTNQLFSTQRLEASKDLRMSKVHELISFVNKCSERRDVVNIHHASFITLINIISNALFSTNLASFDDSADTTHKFHNVLFRMMEIVGNPNVADFFPFLGFLDLQGTRKEGRVVMEKLFRVFQGFIDTKRSSNASRNNNKDMLDSLLDIAQENESELDDKDIKHMLLDLFLAGTETIPPAIEWAMTELLRNPKMIVKAQEEIRQVIGQRKVVEESDTFKLPYLQAVVKETLRFHPSPFLLPRKSESDDVRIFDFLIPKNTQILVNIWAIGRDPNVWENPTQFEPERFLKRDIHVKGNDFELIPFGAGRRMCPGMPLAFRTMHLVLASLLHGFDWKYQNGVVPENVDTSEAFGVMLHRAERLCAVPIKRSP